MESLTAEFQVMLGSAEKAESLVQQITEFAARTPFQVQGLAENTRLLLQFGVEADNVLPTLRMLGDVAGKNQEKLSSLAFAFGKVNSSGRLTGLELRQMIIAGFNPLNLIAAKTGETMEALRKRMSKGGISAQEVADAFKTATSEGGRFYKNMETQSKTFIGLVSTMKDNITLTLAAIGKSLLPGLKDIVDKITKLFQGSFGELLKGLMGFFAPLLNSIIEIIDLIITEFTPIINRLLGSLMPILSQILGLILNLAKPLLKIISSILEPIMTILEGILPIITEILAIFDKMATDVLGDLQPIFADIMQILSDVLQIVLPILRIFLRLQILMLKLKLLFDTAFIKILVKALRIVLTLLQPLISLLQIFLVPLAEKIENIFTSIIGFFEGIVNTIATKFVDLLNGIFNFINKIIAKINQIPFIKDKLKTLDQINMKEAVNKLTGSSINNNTNNRTQNINLNNQITIQGSDLGNTKNMRRIIDQTARNSFSLELKKILVESGGI